MVRRRKKEVVMRDRKRYGHGVRQSLVWAEGMEDLIVGCRGRQQQHEEETVAGHLEIEIRKKS